jgi:serine/threonine protein kinase
MAPEMFVGEPGSVATDIYALGVTLFRAFTREYPYDNLDAVSRPRLERPKELTALRPDLPAWLNEVVGRAITSDPADRYADAIELADEIEAGPSPVAPRDNRPPTFYERHRLRVWQGLAAALAMALAAALWLR